MKVLEIPIVMLVMVTTLLMVGCAGEKGAEAENGRISVNHEWGTLEEVIVGTSEQLTIPVFSGSEQFERVDLDPKAKEFMRENQGKNLAEVDPDLAKKMEEQLDGLVKLLEEKGVTVHRCQPLSEDEVNYLANVQSGVGLLFPRDPILVVGNNVIETECQAPFRRKERYAIRPIFEQILKESEAEYVSMPPAEPGITGEGDTSCLLEGGDVLLNGKEIYVGISGRASNEAGVEWMRRYLGPDYVVHTIRLKPHVLHLDCAMALPGPGLAIVCPERLEDGLDGLPESLKSFDIIEVTEEEALSLGANVLVLDEKAVIVDEQHGKLAKELEKKGKEVLTTPFDAITMWGGSFRCAHHPIRRVTRSE